MGFLKGFLIAMPVGLYFGERHLDFPFTYVVVPNRKIGYFKVDFYCFEQMIDDINRKLIK